jgi:predicted dehydrogenase
MIIGSCRVVGTGSIGARYLRVLPSLMQHQPIAVPIGGALRDSGLAEIATLERLGERSRPHVELCVIASKTERHLDDYRRFVDSADVLLIEKPITSSIRAMNAFDISCPTADVAVASPLRFTEGFGVVQAHIESLGTITGVNVECRSWLPAWRPGTDFRTSYSADATHGGVLLDLVHEIDYCLQLFGSPAGLSATLSHDSVLGIASESSVHLLWRYGAYDLRMVLDYVSRPPSRSLTIYGTRGSLRWDLLQAYMTLWGHDDGIAEAVNFPDDLDRDLILAHQIVATTERGNDPRVSSVAQAWQAVAVCDLAKESSRQFGIMLDARTALAVPDAG